MNMFFLIIAALVVLLVVVVIVILIKGDSNKPKSTANKIDLNSKISIKDIEFPKNIVEMSSSSLSQIVKGLFDTYKSLGYANKSGNALEKQEWHSWQVSMLLVFLKVYQNFFVSHEKNIFHSSILNLDNDQMENDMQKIFRKYVNNVNPKKSRDALSNEIIWSAREVSLILYSIMSNKKY